MFRRVFIFFILTVVFIYCNHASDIPALFLDDARGYSERPAIVSSQPTGNGTAVAASTNIYVDFSVEMDKEITRNAFSLSGVSTPRGRVEWEGRRLKYELEEPLIAGNSYVLRVDRSARSQKGYTLDLDYLVHFIAGSRVDAPTVSSATPAANSQNVAQNSTIRLVFSRAMDRSSVEAAFSLSPSAAGSFAWDADSAAFTYTPYALLSFGTTYSVTLGTGARDQEGIPLAGSFNLSFQVGTDFGPPVVNQIVESGNAVALANNYNGFFKDSSITVDFSEAMNYSATESAFSLTRTSNSTAVNGVFEWNAAFTQLQFTPNAPLEPLSQYLLQLSTVARDLSGNAITAPVQLYFQVSNASGAINSNYVTITQINKTLPLPTNAVTIDPSVVNSIDIGPPPDTITVDIVFSHSLDLNTVAENISVSRLFVNTNPGAGQIISILPGNFGALTNNRLTLEIAEFGLNDYKLEFSGGRTGIRSAQSGTETGSWLQSNIIVFLRGQ
ncbi:MAG: Ig-like domain-containing protein [Spirochaetales bacterium]|nr:Ig-like domain-containing protein [Spirochaetales bacterium]